MESDRGKVFVGGISWETNEDALRGHFRQYGEVAETVIMRDRSTGSARGFGFVLFSDPSAADKVLQDKHVILGRTVEVKKAVPRGERHQNQHQHHQIHQQQNKGPNKNGNNGGSNNDNFRTKKIFVGGLSANLTEEEFKKYFEKFGRITDVVVMYDSATNRPRGFGFITFDSEDAVENVMQKSFHELNDKFVEVKKAVPKDVNSSVNNNNNNNSYNSRVGGGRGSLFGSYQGAMYTHYDPRYRFFPGYALSPLSSYGGAGGYPYGASIYGGGYHIGGFGGAGYGMAPVAAPWNAWNGMGMGGTRRSPVPYDNAAIYPGHMNGGFGGITGISASGHRGIVGPAANGKWNHGGGSDAQTPSRKIQPQKENGDFEDDS